MGNRDAGVRRTHYTPAYDRKANVFVRVAGPASFQGVFPAMDAGPGEEGSADGGPGDGGGDGGNETQDECERGSAEPGIAMGAALDEVDGDGDGEKAERDGEDPVQNRPISQVPEVIDQ